MGDMCRAYGARCRAYGDRCKAYGARFMKNNLWGTRMSKEVVVVF